MCSTLLGTHRKTVMGVWSVERITVVEHSESRATGKVTACEGHGILHPETRWGAEVSLETTIHLLQSTFSMILFN